MGSLHILSSMYCLIPAHFTTLHATVTWSQKRRVQLASDQNNPGRGLKHETAGSTVKKLKQMPRLIDFQPLFVVSGSTPLTVVLALSPLFTFIGRSPTGLIYVLVQERYQEARTEIRQNALSVP
jgi:hypothetical protein